MTTVVKELNELIDLGERIWPKFSKGWRKLIENRHWSWMFEPMDRWELGLALNYTIHILFNIIGERGGGSFNQEEIKRFVEIKEEDRYERCGEAILALLNESKDSGTLSHINEVIRLAGAMANELCSDVEANALYNQHR